MKKILLFILLFGYTHLFAQDLFYDCQEAIEIDLGPIVDCGDQRITDFWLSNIGSNGTSFSHSISFCQEDAELLSDLSDAYYVFEATAGYTSVQIYGLPGVYAYLGPIERCNGPFDPIDFDCLFNYSEDAQYRSEWLYTVPGERYILWIAGLKEEERDFFVRILSSNYKCVDCSHSTRLSFYTQPYNSTGFYEPGEEVEFCARIARWSLDPDAPEWLHAVTLDFGNAWNESTLIAHPPESCDGQGSWGYYDSWISCATGETYGSGFAYDSSQGIACDGDPSDGDPGNNLGDELGDICAVLGEEDTYLYFCWTIQVKEEFEPGVLADLAVTATVWSDGNTGARQYASCNGGSTYTIMNIVNQPIEVIPTIVTDITAACIDEPVTYRLNTAPANASYQWVLAGSDLMFSTDASPVVQYAEAGTYDASLLVSSPSGQDTYAAQAIVQVNEDLAADFDIVYALGSGAVEVIAQGGPFTSLSWTFAGDVGGSSDMTAYTFPASGDYEIRLVAENACGSQEIVKTVSVVIAPNSPSFSQQLIQECNPAIIQFAVDDIEVNASYQWFFPGGNPVTSTATSVAVTYPQSGTYDLRLRMTNAAGSDEKTYTDAVSVSTALPVADFSFDTQEGSPVVTFENQSEAAAQYSWDFGDGTGSAEANPSHIFAGSGFYEVRLFVTNNCGEDLISKTIEVRIPPVPGIVANNDDDCAPAFFSFFAIDQGINNEYLWLFPGGQPSISTQNFANVWYQNPGTYPVYYSVKNNAGEWSNLYTELVTVAGPPTADFSFASTQDPAQIAFSYTGTDVDEYVWDFGDGQISLMPDPQHFFAEPGTYFVNLSVTNVCGEDNITKEVTIASNPASTVSINPNSGCAPLAVTYTLDDISPGTQLSWIFPGGNPFAATGNHVSVSYPQAGNYGYFLSINTASGSSLVSEADAVSVQQCLSVDDASESQISPAFAETNFRIYPNPVGKENLYLQSPHLAKAQTIQLSWIDVTGRLVLREAIDLAAGESVYSLQQKPTISGVYWLRIDWEGGVEGNRVIISE